MKYCDFSYDEAWRIPVEYRKWFIARADKENKKNAEAAKVDRSRSPPAKPRPPAKPKR